MLAVLTLVINFNLVNYLCRLFLKSQLRHINMIVCEFKSMLACKQQTPGQPTPNSVEQLSLYMGEPGLSVQHPGHYKADCSVECSFQ